jgi:hypothetical protein
MTTLVRYTPENRVLDLSSLLLSDYQLITRLHGTIKDGQDTLVCLRPPGGAMHVVCRGGKYFAAHFAGGAHGPHTITLETDEHRRQKDYWVQAAESAGLHAETEVALSTGERGTMDVVITGSRVDTDIECQRKKPAPGHRDHQSVPQRTAKYCRAGLLPIWFNGRGISIPMWLAKVPALGCSYNRWETAMPRPRSALATGFGDFGEFRCIAGFGGRCPDTGGHACRNIHPRVIAGRAGLPGEEVAALVPAGEIVPVQNWNGNVFLVRRAERDRFLEMTDGRHGWWELGLIPEGRRSRVGNDPKPCTNDKHDGSPQQLLVRDDPLRLTLDGTLFPAEPYRAKPPRRARPTGDTDERFGFDPT